MDPLSDVLRAVRLDGAFFYLVEAVHPWSVHSGPAVELTPRVLPGAEHLITYHIVTEGSCWGGVIGEPQVLLEAGDAILFPHGDAHFMSSAEGGRVDPSLHTSRPARYLDTVRVGAVGARGEGMGRRTEFVCGFLGWDSHPFNPLLRSLPRMLHVPRAAGEWLSLFPRQAVVESRRERAGGATVLTRMAELMFVEVLRRHMESVGASRRGWLAALRDPVVGAALAQLHEHPAREWTLADLARGANSSRTVLSERFAELVGLTPMQYLAQWRLQLAAEQLASTAEKVATIGEKVGYESEAAFSRAFKRATGESPAAWRRKRGTG